MVEIHSTDESLVEVGDGICVGHLGANDAMSVQYAEVEPGVETDPHSHVEQQIAFILEGEATFTIDGKQHELSGGDVIVYESNESHGTRVTGDGCLRTLDVFSPPRVSETLEQDTS